MSVPCWRSRLRVSPATAATDTCLIEFCGLLGTILVDEDELYDPRHPDADETSQSLLGKFPTSPVFGHLDVPEGRIWLKQSGVKHFAGDLPEAEQKLVYATQSLPVADLFNQKVEGTAWNAKPNWYVLATQDQTVPPDLQRFVSKRMKAATTEVTSSHVPMLSKPDVVLDVIRKAASTVSAS